MQVCYIWTSQLDAFNYISASQHFFPTYLFIRLFISENSYFVGIPLPYTQLDNSSMLFSLIIFFTQTFNKSVQIPLLFLTFFCDFINPFCDFCHYRYHFHVSPAGSPYVSQFVNRWTRWQSFSQNSKCINRYCEPWASCILYTLTCKTFLIYTLCVDLLLFLTLTIKDFMLVIQHNCFIYNITQIFQIKVISI